jgi:hypothetical protein
MGYRGVTIELINIPPGILYPMSQSQTAFGNLAFLNI